MSAGFFCREAPIFGENIMTDSDLIQKIHNGDQPAAGAENVECTLEDAYLYHIQIAGSEKNAAL